MSKRRQRQPPSPSSRPQHEHQKRRRRRKQQSDQNIVEQRQPFSHKRKIRKLSSTTSYTTSTSSSSSISAFSLSCTLYYAPRRNKKFATSTSQASSSPLLLSSSTATARKLFLVLLLSCTTSMSYTLSTSTTATATSPYRRLSSFSILSKSSKFTSTSTPTKLNIHNSDSDSNNSNDDDLSQTCSGTSGGDSYYPLCHLRRSNHPHYSSPSSSSSSSSTTSSNHHNKFSIHTRQYIHNNNHYNNVLLNRILSGRKSIYQQQQWRCDMMNRRGASTLLGVPRKTHDEKEDGRHHQQQNQQQKQKRRGHFYYKNGDDLLEYCTLSSSSSSSSSTKSSILSNTDVGSGSTSGSTSATTLVASFLPSSIRPSSPSSSSSTLSSSSYYYSNEFGDNHDFELDGLELHPRKNKKRKSLDRIIDDNDDDDRDDLFYLSLRSSYSSIPTTSRRKSRKILNVARGGSQRSPSTTTTNSNTRSKNNNNDNNNRINVDNTTLQNAKENQRVDELIFNSRPVPPLTSTILNSFRQFNNKKRNALTTNEIRSADNDENENYNHEDGTSISDSIRPLCNSDISRKSKKHKKSNSKKPKLQILRYSQHRHQQQQQDVNGSEDETSLFTSSEGAVMDEETKSFSFQDDCLDNQLNDNSKYQHHKLLTNEERTQAKIQWAAKYTSLHTLRQTFGRNRNKFWGDFDSKTTRKLYHTILPRALLGLYDIGLWSPKEIAPLAYEARIAAKKYARERSVVPSRVIAMFYDGFRMWRDWGTWSVEGMSWEQVWDKYETQILEEMIEDCRYDLNYSSGAGATSTTIDIGNVDDEDGGDDDGCCVIDLNERSVQEEITAQICLRILERSCATNGMIDKLFLEGSKDKWLKLDKDLDNSSVLAEKSRLSKSKRRKRLRRKNAERDLKRIRNQLDKDMQELLQIKPSSE